MFFHSCVGKKESRLTRCRQSLQWTSSQLPCCTASGQEPLELRKNERKKELTDHDDSKTCMRSFLLNTKMWPFYEAENNAHSPHLFHLKAQVMVGNLPLEAQILKTEPAATGNQSRLPKMIQDS